MPNVDVDMDEEMVSEGWSVGAPGFFSLTGLYVIAFVLQRHSHVSKSSLRRS